MSLLHWPPGSWEAVERLRSELGEQDRERVAELLGVRRDHESVNAMLTLMAARAVEYREAACIGRPIPGEDTDRVTARRKARTGHGDGEAPDWPEARDALLTDEVKERVLSIVADVGRGDVAERLVRAAVLLAYRHRRLRLGERLSPARREQRYAAMESAARRLRGELREVREAAPLRVELSMAIRESFLAPLREAEARLADPPLWGKEPVDFQDARRHLAPSKVHDLSSLARGVHVDALIVALDEFVARLASARKGASGETDRARHRPAIPEQVISLATSATAAYIEITDSAPTSFKNGKRMPPYGRFLALVLELAGYPELAEKPRTIAEKAVAALSPSTSP